MYLNYVHVYGIFLVNYVIGLVDSPEEGRCLLLKHSVVFCLFFMTLERVLVNAACITKSRLPMKQLDLNV
jgi:hypothetical protein